MKGRDSSPGAAPGPDFDAETMKGAPAAPPRSPVAGALLAGRYQVLSELGRGGMGVRLVRLTEGAKLVSVSVVEAEEVEDESGAATEGNVQ